MESLHPLVVHFPIALLVTALALETVGAGFRWESWRRAASSNLALGVMGAAVAVLTGVLAEGTAKHSFDIEQVLARHEQMGYLVLSLAIAALGWRWATRAAARRWIRWVGWGLMAATCAGLAVGAHLGGRLVYEYGVGGSFGRSSGIEVSVK